MGTYDADDCSNYGGLMGACGIVFGYILRCVLGQLVDLVWALSPLVRGW